MLRSLIVTAVGLACGACSSMPDKTMIPVSAVAEGTTRVPILVATTRQPVPGDPGAMFNGERANVVSYAAVTISVPPDEARTVGHVQWPSSTPGDPRREFVTVAANYIDKNEFSSALASATGGKRRKVLVFVHGFNNRFDDAVFRFAQIVHDSKSPAIPILFTWPSRGEVALRAYTYDRDSATYSRDALEQLLTTLSRNPNVSEINVVAHSMGNWLTLETLRTLAVQEARAPDRMHLDKLKNILLVSPDVDVDVFRSQMHRIGAYKPRIALFLSQDDSVLGLSNLIWGGTARLGDINPNEEPYRSELARDNILVFDLTKLRSSGDSPHSRAFDDITTVMTMIETRLARQDHKSTVDRADLR